MPFQLGSILHVKNFEFKKGGAVNQKNKFLIPLLELDGNILLLSLPSSQVYLSKEKQTPGCIDYKEIGISIYHFTNNSIVGQDGFSFPKNTFIYFGQVMERSKDKLMQYNASEQLEQIDILINDVFIEVIYCAFKGTAIPEKYKSLLENLLKELYQ